MKNILNAKNRRTVSIMPIIIFSVIILFFLTCINRIQVNSESEALNILKKAVTKAVVQCYAIEGQYPKTLEYIENNYGLSYNPNKYVVHYQNMGANILPDIFITRCE